MDIYFCGWPIFKFCRHNKHSQFILKNFADITSAEMVKNREVAKVHLEILLVSREKETTSPGDFRINFRRFSGFFARKLVLERFAAGSEIKLKTFHSLISRRVGVFFCGPAVLSHTLHQMSNKHSGSGTRFYYNKENF